MALPVALGLILLLSGAGASPSRWAASSTLRPATLPQPPVPSEWSWSFNCTEGSPGWCLSNIVASLAYNGNASNAYFEYAVDGSPWERYVAPFLISGDGRHLLNITLYENGSVRSTAWVLLYIDSVPPTSRMEVDPAPQTSGWFDAPPVVRLTGADNDSGLARLEYRLDDRNWVTYTGPLLLPQGVHPFDYRAVDVAGNVESFHNNVLWVDTEAPVLYDLSADVFRDHDGQVAWHAVDSLSGVAGYAVNVDGGPFIPVGLREAFNFSLPDGPHQVEVQATDVAGNHAVLPISIRVDTNPFSYTGPYLGIPTYVVILLAALLVRIAWSRPKRRMRRG